MGRILMVVTVWLVMAAMMLIIAIPVIAKNTKPPGEQGPPPQSGGGNPDTSPEVFHDNSGACVLHPTGKETGGGGGCPEVT
jgi:hypothetical protein